MSENDRAIRERALKMAVEIAINSGGFDTDSILWQARAFEAFVNGKPKLQSVNGNFEPTHIYKMR